MTQFMRRIVLAILSLLATYGLPGQAQSADSQASSGPERFEVTAITAVRPLLVETLSALEGGNLTRAREVFDSYDDAWNGIEVYVNTRSRALYQVLELELQAKITKGLETAQPDLTTVLSDARMMLAKYDDLIELVTKGAPLNPIYDDIARLRIVRAHLRPVNPALKAGNLAKARTSFERFEDEWFNIEDFVRAQSLDAYLAIERGMLAIEEAIMPEPPDVAQVIVLVSNVMNAYNAVVTDVQRQARNAR
jgi:high-affinity iron transporter